METAAVLSQMRVNTRVLVIGRLGQFDDITRAAVCSDCSSFAMALRVTFDGGFNAA